MPFSFSGRFSDMPKSKFYGRKKRKQVTWPMMAFARESPHDFAAALYQAYQEASLFSNGIKTRRTDWLIVALSCGCYYMLVKPSKH